MSEEIGSSERNIKIAIIAGEKSGDQLGGPLMEAIKVHYPNAEFIGVGGDSMKEQGLNSFFNMEDIAVMGIIEPLLSLRKILRLRRDVKFFFKNQNPSLFIGIDSPDFNLPIAKFLKNELNIKTVQYVSPSVWAWRKGRIKKMEKSIDAVFTLFPFEQEAYKNSLIEAYFIGHPLAYKIPILIEKKILREERGFANSQKVIALLPGSRKSEVSLVGNQLVKAAQLIKADFPETRFLMPLANPDHQKLIKIDNDNGLIEFSVGDSREILAVSDLAIITSGTATLESLLFKTPCVTVYKINWLSFKIIKPLLKISNFSLPNLLAEKKLLPELLQNEVTPQNIHQNFLEIHNKMNETYVKEFTAIHESLRAGGSPYAAKIIKELIE